MDDKHKNGSRKEGFGKMPAKLAPYLRALNAKPPGQISDKDREVILAIVKANEDDLGDDLNGVMVPATFERDDEGLLVMKIDGALRVLANTQTKRLRRCLNCRDIFWAARLDQKGCTPRCGDILRKRGSRERKTKLG